jgi:dihydroorotate dehydrogenase
VGKLYKFFRPFLMALPPEAAHSLSLNALKYFPQLVSKYDDPILETKVFGLSFKTPIGIAAGDDKDAKVPAALFDIGFGFVEVGTLTPKPQKGNSKPRIFRLKKDFAVINRLGFNNQGFEAALKSLNSCPKGPRQGVLGINIGANKNSQDTVSDYVLGMETLAHQADYFTINISSPNTPGLRDLQEKEQLTKLVSAVGKALKKASPKEKPPPLLVKIAPDLDKKQLKDIVDIALKFKVDGLIISNTTLARPAGLASQDKEEAGGLSGQPLFDMSTALLAEAFKLSKGKLTLIGVGGVASAEQAYQKILNGASLVQLYTGLIYEGPGLVSDISKGLADLLLEGGFTSVSEAVGKGIKG